MQVDTEYLNLINLIFTAVSKIVSNLDFFFKALYQSYTVKPPDSLLQKL